MNKIYLDRLMIAANQYIKERDYWLEKLSSVPAKSSFPPDSKEKSHDQSKKNTVISSFTGEIFSRLKKLSNDADTRLHIILMTAIVVLINRYTGNNDIIIGTPIYKQNIKGDFINTVLALRIRYEGSMTFKELLMDVVREVVASSQHQNYPIEILPAQLKSNELFSESGFPLFDVAILLENIHEKSYINHLDLNMTFSFLRTDEYLTASVEYSSLLYQKKTIEQIITHLETLLGSVLFNLDTPLFDIEMLSNKEKNRLLYEFNDTKAEFPGYKSINALFEAQVEKAPDHTAVVGANHEFPLQITYKKLYEQSNRLAHILREKNVSTDTVVGLLVDRSIEMIVGILGILTAGGAYLPIAPEYPQKRIDFMLKDSGAEILLTSGELLAGTDGGEKLPYTSSGANPNAAHQHLAYIIYTSGSSGQPKGVAVVHHSVVNRLNWMQGCYPIGAGDMILQKTTFTFDVSVWELFWWSWQGAAVCLLPPGGEKDPEEIVNAMERNRVTTLHFVPSMLNLFLDYIEPPFDLKRLSALRQVFASGETLLLNQVERFNTLLWSANRTKLINLYGPTEATVDVSYFNCSTGEELTKVPVGKPIDNIGLYVMDKSLKLQPVGVAGELCISGVGLARGYLNRPELTEEKFNHDLWDYQLRKNYKLQNTNYKQITNHKLQITNKATYNEKFLQGGPGGAVFSKSAPPGHRRQKIYKSGDLARWLPDGNIEFLGRFDHQVKIRGIRIEPGEIENRLQAVEYIKETVVINGKDEKGDEYLAAYIVSVKTPDTIELRDILSKSLPLYMIPSYFVQIPRIPLTPNGKLDRSKLPGPKVNSGKEYVPPKTKIQEELVDSWKDVLELEKIGLNDNFFNIGGDSIKAIRLVSSINNRFHTNIRLSDLFSNNTIGKLAKVVKSGTAAPRDKELIEAEKEIEELKTRIMNSGKAPADVEDVFPMSDIEKGMIFHAYRNPDESIYHDQFVYNRKYSMFNPGLFRRALELMMEKHSILRVSYNVDDFNEFVHYIHKPFPAVYNHFDIRESDTAAQRQYILKYMAGDRKDRWDITSPPLCRMATFHLGSDNICAVWTFHHAMLDGWSNASLMTELNNTYFKLKVDKNYTPARLKISYKNFIIHEMIEKKKVSNIDFWKKELAGYKRISFPDAGRNEPGETHDFIPEYSMVLNEKLIDASKRYNTSLKNICFAAYVYMLNMLTYDNDVTVGLISNNRPEIEDGDKLIGCFLNTLPFRINIPAEITCEDYIHMVDKKLIRLKRYEKITFFEIVKVIGERNPMENPIFDTIFSYIDFHIYKQAVAENDRPTNEQQMLIQGYERTNTLFDFLVNPYLQGIRVKLRYSTSVISDDMVEKLYGYFENVLKLIISRPGELIKKGEIFSIEEKQKLLYEFNHTDAQYPKEKTVHELFEEQVEQTPDNLAVTDSSISVHNIHLTYRELNEKSNRLAYMLRTKGVGPDNIVLMMMNRSVKMIIGIFGILKAGGAYLPIDPEYPDARNKFILLDCQAGTILTQKRILDKYRYRHRYISPGNIIFLDDDTIYPRAGSNPILLNKSKDAAYIIYTSGSTGRPKGVIVDHRSLVNYVWWAAKNYIKNANTTFPFYTSISFDLTVTSIFLPLITGNAISIYEEDEKELSIQKVVEDYNVETIKLTPSHLKLVKENGKYGKSSNIKCLIVGGEEFDTGLAKAIHDSFAENIEIYNEYGPTEATVGCMIHRFTPGKDNNKSVPLGIPADNMKIYLLDRNLEPVVPGVIGEISISGHGVARGYLNRPEVNHEKFVKNSFVPGERFYKTGDLARWLPPDRNIEFIGRMDSQLKVRGYRIEPGEIEIRLLKHENIKEAVVLAKKNNRKHAAGEDGHVYIYAYFTANKELSVSQLKAHLSKDLPAYMLPSYFVKVEKIPLTPNGKIDKEALLLYDENLDPGVEYAAPGNNTEELIAAAWKEVLQTEKIGVQDNFFDVGGHSLLLIRVIDKLRIIFQKDIPLVAMFRHLTIRSMAHYLDNSGIDESISNEKIDRSLDVQEETIKLMLGD